MPSPNCSWAVRTAVFRRCWSVSASWAARLSNCSIAEASSVWCDASCSTNSFILLSFLQLGIEGLLAIAIGGVYAWA